MNCHLYRDAVIELARGTAAAPDAAAHVDGCERCRARLAQERQLSAGLRAVAASLADAHPSERLEASLMAAFAGQHAPRAAAPRPWRSWLTAAAAIALLVAGAFQGRAGFERARRDPAPPPVSAASSEFVPWPGASVLPAFESGQLVRMELPASVLPLLGIVPARVSTTDNKVLADVLVGQDGLARAVRIAQ